MGFIEIPEHTESPEHIGNYDGVLLYRTPYDL